MPTFFAQECPTCGRTLHVRFNHANRRVVCKHCQGAFVATAEEQRSNTHRDWRTAIVRRADELLAAAVARQADFAHVA